MRRWYLFSRLFSQLGVALVSVLATSACGGSSGSSSSGSGGAGAGGASTGGAGAGGAGAGGAGAGGASTGGPGAGGAAQALAGASSTGGGAKGDAGAMSAAGAGAAGAEAGTGGQAGASPGATSGSGGQAAARNGCIVPLYSYPTDAPWSTIVQAKQAHPAVAVVAIVNPDSGPGASVDKLFTTGISKLVSAGIVPIGYVSTNYTKRGQPAVNADVDSWRAFYPAVQGIFFDEQSVASGDEGFYAAVSAHAKGKGFTLTVGNPGTNVPSSFLGALDVMLSYESAGTPVLSSLTQYAAHREQFGIIPYATTFDAMYVKAAVKSVRYVYLTNDDLPNPWDTLPTYFDALLTALAP